MTSFKRADRKSFNFLEKRVLRKHSTFEDRVELLKSRMPRKYLGVISDKHLDKCHYLLEDDDFFISFYRSKTLRLALFHSDYRVNSLELEAFLKLEKLFEPYSKRDRSKSVDNVNYFLKLVAIDDVHAAYIKGRSLSLNQIKNAPLDWFWAVLIKTHHEEYSSEVSGRDLYIFASSYLSDLWTIFYAPLFTYFVAVWSVHTPIEIQEKVISFIRENPSYVTMNSIYILTNYYLEEGSSLEDNVPFEWIVGMHGFTTVAESI